MSLLRRGDKAGAQEHIHYAKKIREASNINLIPIILGGQGSKMVEFGLIYIERERNGMVLFYLSQFNHIIMIL